MVFFVVIRLLLLRAHVALQQAVGDKAEPLEWVVAPVRLPAFKAFADRAERAVSKLDVEVLGRFRISDKRSDGRLAFPALQLCPVDPTEETMFLDRRKVFRRVVAQALVGLLAEELRDEVFRVERKVGWHDKFASLDALLDLLGSIAFKGSVAGKELESEDANSPPINFRTVFGLAVARENFRGHVLRGAEERETTVLVSADLRKAKVGKEEVSGCVEEAVFRLEIAVNNTNIDMKVGQGEDQLCDVKGNRGLGEHAHFREMVEQLAALRVSKHS